MTQESTQETTLQMTLDSEYLKRLYRTKKRSDFVIIFNGMEYNVHLAIVANRSKYFENLMFDDFKELVDGQVNIEFMLISQDVFQHFLGWLYGFELDVEHLLPMTHLADYFRCGNLVKGLEKHPLYRLAPSAMTLKNISQLVIPTFTLTDQVTILENDKLLLNAMLWFTANIEALLSLEADVLRLIPIEWLRYVFGTAPVHLFKSELARLDKALELYSILGPSDELYAALFEGIKLVFITGDETLGMKYHPLYRHENIKVLENLLNSRASSMLYRELKDTRGIDFQGSSLTITVDDYTRGDEWVAKAQICKDVACTLKLYRRREYAFDVCLWVQPTFSAQSTLSYFSCVVENDLSNVFFSYKEPKTLSKGEYYAFHEAKFLSSSSKKVTLIVQIQSLSFINE
jgi:hypothetical protein